MMGWAAARVARTGDPENGARAPVSAVTWAHVSAEVDQRLSDPTLPSLRLKPDEWRSGDILWLIDAVGDGNAIPHLLQRLYEGPFAAREIKMRRAAPNGSVAIGKLSEHMASGVR